MIKTTITLIISLMTEKNLEMCISDNNPWVNYAAVRSNRLFLWRHKFNEKLYKEHKSDNLIPKLTISRHSYNPEKLFREKKLGFLDLSCREF